MEIHMLLSFVFMDMTGGWRAFEENCSTAAKWAVLEIAGFKYF